MHDADQALLRDERLILNGLSALTRSDDSGVAECMRQLLPLQ
jgi:hypothetical protein